MANIKKLQLNGEDIIPITHESAVIDDNGISIVDKYQTKEDQNLDTNSKTIIGAINELNVNNVHLGNTLGAIEYDDNDNPIINRLDDLESSLIRLIGNSSNNDNNDIINDLNNQINELEDNIENTRNTLAGLMTEGGYNITGDEDINNLLDLLVLSGISLGDIKQIACGGNFTFILKKDGTVWSCGSNEARQLGLSITTDTNTFGQVTTNVSNDVKQIACGGDFTFILKKDGSVWSCGYNYYGQLGFGDTTDRTAFTKVTTNINNDVAQIICGYYHTFIIKNDGSVWACGYNSYGQLGLGNTTNQSTFTQVTTNINNDVKQIICGGGYQTFIIKNDGSIWSCGSNNYGQLGLGDTTQRNVFTQVTTNVNNDVKQVACGYTHTVILKNDGSVWSCGDNDDGRLGLGNTTNKNTFTQVTTNVNNDIKKVACGYYHTFIIKNDGSLWACGYNSYGQLGLGNTNDRTTFTKVTTGINNDVNQISCGTWHIFILKNNGSVWSCGRNNYGQLGLGDTTNRTTFTMIPRGLQ